MKQFYMQLRIGEKIGLSCGVVVLLFLIVVWQYHQTLKTSLADYQQLHAVFAAKKGHALQIENHMLEARRAEKDFLLHRDDEHEVDVIAALNTVQTEAEALAQVDPEGADTAERIAELVRAYQQRFESVARAWEVRGLDHSSGLQGAFRDAVHRLEARAEHFKAGDLYLQLLQIRRGEKDLALRREAEYRDLVTGLIGAFEARVETSNLKQQLKQALLNGITDYRDSFLTFAESVLDGGELHGGKGPFRDAAHRIEALLDAHHVPDMDYYILQLRRREKDYLLRGDRQYVDMAMQELSNIHRQLDDCAIADADKTELNTLLDDYQRDFLALVDQNETIDKLQSEMRDAVAEVTLLVRRNAREAEQAAQASSERIHSASEQNARDMLWVAGLAALFAVIAAVVITLSTTRPLRRIAGVLEQMACEEPVNRLPAVPGGRDEVNAMAESVNTMADHKSLFLEWWKSSMREKKAYRQAAGQPDSEAAQLELEQSQREKQALVSRLHEEIRTQLHSVSEHNRKLLDSGCHGQQRDHSQAVAQAAKSALATLEVLRRR